ncbi:hypothetical protein [Komagataeibacter oboediens]|uniref:hypothetical protein n=1 Tax=Komagataeibacter oboediens TaxID=65958 RepID=UPI0019062D67|nr:hypothetical protein [Komagataeibacter oboediens]
MSEKADHSSPAPLDMGKKSNEIRLWKANQAVRHGELRLAAQSTALTGAQTRATSLLTWVVPLMGVSLGIILNKDYIAAGWVLLTGNAVTAVLCATALAPTAWSEAGFKPVEVLDIPYDSELLCQEAVAVTYQESIQKNDRRMKKFTRLMQGAWWVFLITPPIAGLLQFCSPLKSMH